MIKSAKLIEILESQIARLKKFEDEELSAFVLILPPAGNPINFLTMDADTDTATFFNTLAARLKATLEESQAGGVSVPGYRR